MKKSIILLTLSWIGNFCFGQDKELDPVTVVGTITPINASETGRNIFVLKGSEIAALPVKSLDELLRYIPGVEVQSRGTMGSQSDFTIRGGTFQQVLVIVDGLRLNDPNTGHFSSYIPVTLDEIEKIEILKGPASALYGSDAVGGVINIITKAFVKRNKQANELNAAISAGQLGLLNGSISQLYSNGKTTFQIAGLSNNADGQAQRGIDGFVHNNTLGIAVSHNFSHWNVAFRTSYDSRNFAAQNFYTNFISDTAREKVKTFWNQVNLTYQKNNNQVSVLAGFKNTEDNFAFNNVSTANSSFSNLFQLSAFYVHQFSAKTIVTSGWQYVGRNINSNDRGNHTVNQFAAYSILQQTFAKNIFINSSLRYDWNEISGGTVIPQINISYKKNNIQLRGSAGNTLRYADFTELYNNYNKTLVTAGKIGNPFLSAEKTVNYELGVDWFAKKHVKISFDIFQRNSNGLIDWANTLYNDMPRKENLLQTGTYLLAKNISQVITSGAELDMQFNKAVSVNSSLMANAGLVWLNSEAGNGPLTLYLSSHAKFLSNFSFKYLYKNFAISLNGIYKVRTPQMGTAVIAAVSENYFVMNMKLEKKLVLNKLLAFVEVDNIFNATYNDFLGTTMPKRWLMAGIQFSLK